MLTFCAQKLCWSSPTAGDVFRAGGAPEVPKLIHCLLLGGGGGGHGRCTRKYKVFEGNFKGLLQLFYGSFPKQGT